MKTNHRYLKIVKPEFHGFGNHARVKREMRAIFGPHLFDVRRNPKTFELEFKKVGDKWQPQ